MTLCCYESLHRCLSLGSQKASTWGQTLRAVYTFDTVEDFWWCVLAPLSFAAWPVVCAHKCDKTPCWAIWKRASRLWRYRLCASHWCAACLQPVQ